MQVKMFLPLAVILFAAGPATAAPDDDFLIVPGERVGRITGDATENSLRAVYGEDRVEPVLVDQGEGFVCQGTRIGFEAGESLEVTWLDTAKRSRVGSVHVKGRRWTTAEGVRLGVTLRKLESINDGTFKLAGFGWDYAGAITSWAGGRLDRLSRRTWLYLAPQNKVFEQISSEDLLPVMGDGIVSSAHPIMQRLNPRLVRLVVRLAADQRCESFFPG